MPKFEWGEVRSGTQLGRWLLVRQLGQGGNGTVWLGRDQDGYDVAVKVLRSPTDEESYRRFAQEVRVHLESLRDEPGVLPLIEAEVPTGDRLREPPWLAMPVAQLVKQRITRDTRAIEVIDHMARVAETLAGLLERFGISHRDIKPSNLFWKDGEVLIGDFGLVELPDGEDLTRPNRDLGPRNFLAPEMRARSPLRAGPPADVFSLALTTFDLLGGVAPRDGLRSDVEAHRLVIVRDDPEFADLDMLLRGATSYEARNRPTMRRFAEELRTWLRPSISAPGVPDPVSFRAQFHALGVRPPVPMAKDPEAEREYQALQNRVSTASEPTFTFLTNLGLEGCGPPRLFQRLDPAGLGCRMYRGQAVQPHEADGAVWLGAVAASGGPNESKAHVILGWTIAPFDGPPRVVWSVVEEFTLSSVADLRRCDDLITAWASKAEEAVSELIVEVERWSGAAPMPPPPMPDRSPPTLRSLSFVVQRLAQDGTCDVIATANLVDVESGVAGAGYRSSPSQIRLRGPGDELLDLVLSANGNRVSGSKYDGWYESSGRIEPFHQRGEWIVEYILLADQAGHNAHMRSADLSAAGFPHVVQIP